MRKVVSALEKRTKGHARYRTREGAVSLNPPTELDIRRITRVLRDAYRNPRHGNPKDPLDDLVYIILSTRTRDSSFTSTFQNLKREFPDWNAVFPKSRSRIERLLVPGGLGKLKTRQVIAIIRNIRDEFGIATLAPLAKMTNSEAESFLTSLPGVGPKIAKCVLMYALNRRVLPVDVHVHRVASRLGFRTKKRPDTSQQLIESAVPAELRYSFHVNAIAHGRKLCLNRNPKCAQCPISRWCQYDLRRGGRRERKRTEATHRG